MAGINVQSRGECQFFLRTTESLSSVALGIVDLIETNGLRIWGLNRKAAQFEASKAFAQQFMERHGIPTARAGAFDDAGAARRFVESIGGRCAVKADGLALGKGVLIC